MIDSRSYSHIYLAVAALVLTACSPQKEPAGKMISDIQEAVAAAPDAAKYVPDQLADVQQKLGGLKADYDKEDFKGVVKDGPPVLSEAQGLESAAAAKKDLIAHSQCRSRQRRRDPKPHRFSKQEREQEARIRRGSVGGEVESQRC
jgi:hypothetical protein